MTLHQGLLIIAAVSFFISLTGVFWAALNEKAMLAAIAFGLLFLALAQIFA